MRKLSFANVGQIGLTKRLRGIHAAWHFWYAVIFGGESGVRKLGLGGTHPLTQRYVNEVYDEKLSESRYLRKR
ncbi:DUF3265 domain-containing protein [Vibrio vulnificus]|nr:DUF3265 domain-containing protein [Vibrio vulnificus]MCG9655573.1 DUF3265 domain-containing protein [Vibrio vulnificus]